MKAKRASTLVGLARAARMPAKKQKAEAPRQKLKSDTVRVVCCSELMTGMTAELNLLSGGNGPFFIGENGNGKCLKEGAIHDDKIDGFTPHGTVWTAKEVSKARYAKLLK